MALSYKLEMRQSQQLVMTPQLQQAIKLLQLSNFELNQYVDAELERNPLLERDERSDGPVNSEAAGSSGPLSDAASGTGPDQAAANGVEVSIDLSKPSDAAASSLDTDYENIDPDASRADIKADIGPSAASDRWDNVSSGRSSGDGNTSLEAYVAEDLSLKDYLTQQLNLALFNPGERLIGQHFIDMVDEAGYLRTDLDRLAQKLGAPMSMVEDVLATMQAFEPTGVFARSLGECMALQLKEQNRYDPQIALFLNNLQLLASHNIPALRRAVGVDMDELSDMIAEIKSLCPKPGLAYGSVPVQPVVPDVHVRAATDGSWHVELNSDTLPRILVNRTYYAMVSKHVRSDGDKDYIVDCLQTANWLTKSLDQRARTILKVSQEIVRQQDAFLTHGVQHLRPINLKTVAEAINMHESTVSRVTSNKYMATSRGIFELKYFFTSSIGSSRNGEAHSSESVRYRIKQLIDAETVKAVLSDDKIVERLKIDGIDIARRTVAKYREALRIPSSVQRRREKKMLAHAGG